MMKGGHHNSLNPEKMEPDWSFDVIYQTKLEERLYKFLPPLKLTPLHGVAVSTVFQKIVVKL